MILKIYIDEDKYSLIVNKEELDFLFNAMFNIRCEECEYYNHMFEKCEGNNEKCVEIRRFIEDFKEKSKGEKNE